MRYLIIILVLCLVSQTFGATYYIHAQNGDNGNDGLSWGNAWATLDTLGNSSGVFGSGDTAYLFGIFIHVGKINAHYGGTGSDRTAIIAGNGSDNTPTRGGAVLIGGDTLQTWSDQGGNVWRCSRGVLDQGGIGGVAMNDTLLYLEETSTPTTPAAGYFGHDGTYIYIRLHGDGDPNGEYIMGWDDWSGVGNSHSMFSYHDNDIASPTGHTTYWGLDVKYFPMFLQLYEQINIDSITIERCNFRYSSSPNYSNGAMIGMFNGNSTDTSNFAYGWIIRACSLGYQGNMNAGRERLGAPIIVYSFMDMTIDSNTFYGDLGFPYFGSGNGSRGILLKNSDAISGTNHVFRMKIAYNKFDLDFCDDAINTWWNHQIYTEIYGNVIKGAYSGFDIAGDASPINVPPYASFNKIYNNTVVNSYRSYHNGMDASHMTGWDNEIKFNVFAYTTEFAWISPRCTTGFMLAGTSLGWAWDASGMDTTHYKIDSNMYYSIIDTVFELVNVGVSDNLTDWFNLWGWDEHSMLGTDPDFNDTANFDYSRPNASGEMDTTYGGQAWTIYGAVQNAEIRKHFKGIKK